MTALGFVSERRQSETPPAQSLLCYPIGDSEAEEGGGQGVNAVLEFTECQYEKGDKG